MTGDALDRVRARGYIGIRLGLGRMRALLARLGDPQAELRGALIAGTNGKGSVGAMVAAMLKEAGLTTSQSPSPHLGSYRERLLIDGQPISAADLDTVLVEVLDASESGEAEHGPATEFELFTAASFLWAQRQAVDIAVMEVGLGGRLDATNCWASDVAVITNVALDHEQYLGSTLEAVAREKAAIIKRGSIAVTGAIPPALGVIRRRARRMDTSLKVAVVPEVLRHDTSGLTLEHDRIGRLHLPLLGRHQAANAAVATTTVAALGEAGAAAVDDEAVRRGMAATRWPGRMELLRADGVTVLLDGAHNPAGAAALSETVDELRDSLPRGRATLLLGIMEDKEVMAMLAAFADSELLRNARLLPVAVPGTDRSLPAQDLAVAWSGTLETTPVVATYASVDTALSDGLDSAAAADGLLVVAGSLYLIGYVRERLATKSRIEAP